MREQSLPDKRPSARSNVGGAATFIDALAVYLQPRVLIVLFLGFSAGLPLALSGSTLLVWRVQTPAAKSYWSIPQLSNRLRLTKSRI